MIETVSEEVHKMWVKWSKEIALQESGLSDTRVMRWKKCWIPYKDLSDEMKEKDRKIACKFIKIIQGGINETD